MSSPVLSDFDLKLMAESRARRDDIVAKKLPACVNCKWAKVIPARSEKDDTAAYYLNCTFGPLPYWADERWRHGPRIVAHMSGEDCAVFEANQ